MKKATVSSLELLIGFIIMILIIAAIALIGYNISKGRSDTMSIIAFDKLVDDYKKCKDVDLNKCVCGVYDFSLLSSDHSIEVVNLRDDKTKLSLKKGDLETRFIVIENDNLCFYNFDEEKNKFEVKNAPEFKIIKTMKSEYAEDYYAGPFLQLFKYDNLHTCFVQKVEEEFEVLKQQEKDCFKKDMRVENQEPVADNGGANEAGELF